MGRRNAAWLGFGVAVFALTAGGAALAQSVASQPVAPAAVPASVPAPAVYAAVLNAADTPDETGRLTHTERVTLAQHQAIDIGAASQAFNAWITVMGPGGILVANDDAPGEGTNARVRFVAPVAGEYRVIVMPASPGGSGPFQLTIAPAQPGAAMLAIRAPLTDPYAPDVIPVAAPSAPPAGPAVATFPTPTGITAPAASAPSGAPHTFGVFVGVTDYPGNDDIFRGAEDAEELARAFEERGIIRPGDAVVLTNARASMSNVRYAFATLAQRATPRDTVVFYFGGHGSRSTISLYQESFSAPALASAMAPFAGRSLVVLDSCYAGSFASMVQGVPGRLGLFSSRADETSYVADEVQASGWLIYFVLRAVRGEAPAGSDGQLQWSELASYLQRSYQLQVNGRQHLALAQGTRGNPTLW